MYTRESALFNAAAPSGLESLDQSQMVSKARWYLERARNMTPVEVAHRITEALRARTPTQRWLRTRSPKWEATSNPPILNILDLTSQVESLGSSELMTDLALSGRIDVFGYVWRTEGFHWNRDPATGHEWPYSGALAIDYRHAQGADPKYSWEVNRLLFLLPICRSVSSGHRREECLEFLRDITRSWIGANQVGIGIAWSAAIEASIRAIVLTVVAATLDAHGVNNDRLGESVAEHSAWIRRFPSRFSSANNHRVAELSALIVAGATWTGLHSAEDQATHQAELGRVVESLFAADGVGLEQSPTYAGFSIELALIALLISPWRDNALEHSLRVRLMRAVACIGQFTGDDGRLIRYGDDDEGKVLASLIPDENYCQLLHNLAGLKAIVRDPGITTFATGGHSIMRFTDHDFETMWVFDHAPLGFGTIAAHGHADALSVQLRSGGVDWLIDPGTYIYHGDRLWRDYFRSSLVHNAPAIAGLDSSSMTGAFNWSSSKRADANLVASSCDGTRAAIEASHDGYKKLGYGTVFRRLTRVGEASYSLEDWVTDRACSVTTAFHVSQKFAVSPIDNDGFKIEHPDSGQSIVLNNDGAVNLTLITPAQDASWISPRFGSKEACWRLEFQANLQPRKPMIIRVTIVAPPSTKRRK